MGYIQIMKWRRGTKQEYGGYTIRECASGGFYVTLNGVTLRGPFRHAYECRDAIDRYNTLTGNLSA